jgi:hypoxanthine phosphoribosyltransferase
MSSEPKVLIKHGDIEKAIDRLASEIRRDYKDKNPLLIAILKGSFIFISDLVRKMDMPLEVDFVRLSSYGSNKESSGEMKVITPIKDTVKDRHLLIVEDIIDSGITMSYFINYLKQQGPLSIRLCALTDKPSRRKTDIEIDYLGFSVPDKFVVGYGIDWDEKFRYLPDICYIE